MLSQLKHNKNFFKQAIKFIILLASLIYVISFLHNHKDALGRFKQIDLRSIFYLFVLYFLALLILCYRYKLILEKCGQKSIGYWSWFQTFIIGQFLNRVIPQLGNIYRSYSLKQTLGLSYKSYVASYLSFTWLDTSLNLLISFVITILFSRGLKIIDIDAGLIIIILLFCILFFPVTAYFIMLNLNFKSQKLELIKLKISSLIKVTLYTVKSPFFLLKIIFTGLIAFLITTCIFYVSFKSLGIDMPLSLLAIFCSFLKLSNMLVITPGNLGVREIAYGFLAKAAAQSMSQAMIVSMLIRIVSTLLILMMGMAFGGWRFFQKKNQNFMEEMRYYIYIFL